MYISYFHLCNAFDIYLEYHSADCDPKANFEIFMWICEHHEIKDYEIKAFTPLIHTLALKKAALIVKKLTGYSVNFFISLGKGAVTVIVSLVSG